MKTKEEIKEFYEKFTKNLIRDRIYSNPRHLKIIGYLKEIFSERRFNRALEIGCGIGVISEFIAKNINRVVGIDISEENIKFAKATVKKVEFYCGDFLEFTTNDKFDLITLFDVLEHFPKTKHLEVFNKIKELSNPETIITITIPDPHFISYIKEHHPEKLQVVDESIYFDELKLLFDKNNLEIIRYERYGIDYNNQYRFYLLDYKKENYSLEKTLVKKENIVSKVFKKILIKKEIIIGKFKFRKFLKP